MTRIIRAMLLIVFVVLIRADADHVSSGGSAVSVFPASGAIGTPVHITGAGWPPDVQVSVWAGFTEDPSARKDEVEYAGVIGTATSNDDGEWRLEVNVGGALALPAVPGFVHFRADPAGLPPWLEEVNVARFALVVNGQRPERSGEVRITVTQAPGFDERLGFLAMRQVGTTTSFQNRVGIRTMPAYSVLSYLTDGDYEITVETVSGLQPIGPGLVNVIGVICNRPNCDGVERLFRVGRVSIRNGSVANVSFVFGDVETLPNGGSGPEPTGRPWGWLLAIAGLAVTGALLTGLGASRLLSSRPAVL